MDETMRDLLELTVGEPPRMLSLEAIHRRARMRRAAQFAAASLAAVVLVGFGTGLSAGAITFGAPATNGAHHHTGPPPFYVEEAGGGSLAVRATASGHLTAVVNSSPAPGLRCGGQIAAASNQTYFLICTIWRSSSGQRGKSTMTESFAYRFHVTSSGHVSGYSRVLGSALKGLYADNIAASPDGSQIAVEVLKPDPKGNLYTNTVPAGIFIINTRTGARALWHSGPYRPGAIQFAGASTMSFSSVNDQLVATEARCHRNQYQSNCTGADDIQVRAYSPAAKGGSLERGKVLFTPSRFRARGMSLGDALISRDDSTLTVIRNIGNGNGTSDLFVVRVSVATGRVLRVLYRVNTGEPLGNVFLRFFTADPSGRFLILDASAHGARVNGWIDHGTLVPLVPRNGDDVLNEAW